MALLDELFRGGLPGDPEAIGGQEALLNELFRTLQNKQGGIPVASALAQVPATSQPPPLDNRTVRDVPNPGVPYQPPAAGTVPSDVASRVPAPSTPPAKPYREPSVWDRLGALARGYNTGGLIGGIADAMGGVDRQIGEQNATYRALLNRTGDADLARVLVSNPDVMKAVLPKLFVGDTPTDELREYQYDIRQRIMRGEKDVPTFGEWKANLRRAGATNVNVGGQENSFAKELGKQQADRLGSLVKGADAARNQLTNLDAIEAGLQMFNSGSLFGTGSLGPYEMAFRSYAKSLGVGDADTLAGAELAQSVQNRMALMMRNPDGGMGMPGALSDADREFLRSSQPGIDKSPEGNRRMIEMARRLERRKIEIAELASQYAAQHGNLNGLENVIRDYAAKNPLFDDLKSSMPPARKMAPAIGPGGSGSYRVLGVR